MYNIHHGDKDTRLANLQQLYKNTTKPTTRPEYCNNHVHTFYSFSPYSPCEAVFNAYTAGLQTVGIMDHDSVSGAYEFLQAGDICNMGVTVGAECRADMSSTKLNGIFINNPDQKSVAYMAMHGINKHSVAAVAEFFAPICVQRGERNRAMLQRCNQLTQVHGITLDYDTEVLPLSKQTEGGSVTERHLMYALAKKVYEKFYEIGSIDFCEKMGIKLSDKQKSQLLEPADDYLYRLLSVFKGELIPKIYIDAKKELPDIKQLVEFCQKQGIVLAYPYLGDIESSVTGDKKAQKFEDDFLDMLFEQLQALGIKAVTYMPARNTKQQLLRLQALCKKHCMFEISGEDINMPSQSFICEKLTEPEFAHLVNSTFALIGHECAAAEKLENALIYKDFNNLQQYIDEYSEKAKKLLANK